MEFAQLAEIAGQMGFAKIGVCSTTAFIAQKELVDSQPPLKERAQLRFDPQADDPQGHALVVLLWPYAPVPLPAQENEVFVDGYYAASNAAYHAAKRLEEDLENKGYHARANVSYPAKAAAVRAGLGVIGHNGLLITPEYGTRVVIILMLTDAVEADALRDSAEARSCLQCGRCAAACPSGAIDEKGMSHPERCLRNYMMEGIVASKESREAMGMSMIGCDQCQRACPMQKTAEQPRETEYVLDALMTVDPVQFSQAVGQLAKEIGRNAARPQRVRAQAAILAGNRMRAADLPVLREWEKSEFDAVREHAHWAIERIESRILGLDQCSEKR